MHVPKRCLSLTLALAATAFAATPMIASAASGKALYSQHCAMCHGPGGKGAVPGAPDFTKAGGVLAQSDSVLTHRVLNGYKSSGSPMAMPPQKSVVSKSQVHEILEYMHKAFGVAAKSD